MIEHVLDCAAALHPCSTTIVVGHQAEALASTLARRSGLTLVVQEPQHGTAHALLTAAPALVGATGTGARSASSTSRAVAVQNVRPVMQW